MLMEESLSSTASEAAQENRSRQAGQESKMRKKNNTLFRTFLKRNTFTFVCVCFCCGLGFWARDEMQLDVADPSSWFLKCKIGKFLYNSSNSD